MYHLLIFRTILARRMWVARPRLIHLFLDQSYCTDTVTHSLREVPFWDALDGGACNGADISSELSTSGWLDCISGIPAGCVLKEVTRLHLEPFSTSLADFQTAAEVHIYVDGGYSPSDPDTGQPEFLSDP